MSDGHLPEVVAALAPEDREKLEAALDAAVGNAVSHCKRSLLDYLDYMRRLVETLKPEVREPFYLTIEAIKRRVHNDVSLVKDTVDAATRLYRTGGKIPPFGRTEEARQTNAGRTGLHSSRS